jgi:hypothetical protein
MSQTSYSINLSAVAFPGQPADIGVKDKTSALAVAAAIPYGVLVVRDISNSSGFDKIAGKVPALSADITAIGSALGVSIADQARAQDPSVAAAVYPINSAVSVMRTGRIWVVVEETVVAGDLPFVRFAAGGGGTQLGAFRKSADTATAVALPTAVYVSGAASGGYAVVELNLA